MRVATSIVWAVVIGFLPSGAASARDFKAVDYQRRTIYHSPQTPGYTCWVYASVMPDESIMIGFFQATGPKEGRPRAPEEVQKKLSWPHLADPRRDMTGLSTCNVFLRSTDGGATWRKVSEDSFRTPMNGVMSGAVGLRDGTILRTLKGAYLAYHADLPRTSLVQRSIDGTKTWDTLTTFLPGDRFTVNAVGMRCLRDGRVAVLGGVARLPCGRASSEYGVVVEPLILVSNDAGRTWGDPIQVIPEENRKGWACEECDAVELPSGDLFWVFRRCVPEHADRPLNKRAHTYWQGVTEKQGDTWKPKWVGSSPFPNLGLPNLLATQEGVVLNVNARHWTADQGKTWQRLNLPPTAYYPKGVQLTDGRILVFGHTGSDDPYGKVDQKIVMDSFRLQTQATSQPK